jgi:hypothetical protein
MPQSHAVALPARRSSYRAVSHQASGLARNRASARMSQISALATARTHTMGSRANGWVIPGNERDELEEAFEKLERETPDALTRAICWVHRPQARVVRIPLGIICIVASFFWFLPVIGVEWLPIGRLLIAPRRAFSSQARGVHDALGAESLGAVSPMVSTKDSTRLTWECVRPRYSFAPRPNSP